MEMLIWFFMGVIAGAAVSGFWLLTEEDRIADSGLSRLFFYLDFIIQRMAD